MRKQLRFSYLFVSSQCHKKPNKVANVMNLAQGLRPVHCGCRRNWALMPNWSAIG